MITAMVEEKIRSLHDIMDELYKWKSREDVLKEKLRIVESQVKHYKNIISEVRRSFRSRAFIRFLRKLFGQR